jgi:hypothetical protein
MRKLLLLLFLFTLNSNALAKVEIWECVTYICQDETIDCKRSNSVHKINTDIPEIFARSNAEWLSLKPHGDIIYDRDNDKIDIYHHKYGKIEAEEGIELWPYLSRFDLVLKTQYRYMKNGRYVSHKRCKVIE